VTLFYNLTQVSATAVNSRQFSNLFRIYPNLNSYANPNPNPAMSDCYIQACGIGLLAGGCSGMVSRVRVSVKAMVRDRGHGQNADCGPAIG